MIWIKVHGFCVLCPPEEDLPKTAENYSIHSHYFIKSGLKIYPAKSCNLISFYIPCNYNAEPIVVAQCANMQRTCHPFAFACKLPARMSFNGKQLREFISTDLKKKTEWKGKQKFTFYPGSSSSLLIVRTFSILLQKVISTCLRVSESCCLFL